MAKKKILERNWILPTAAQNTDINTNYNKAKIDKTQQNSKCMFCGDRDEIINDIISKCSELAQNKYKTRHNWVKRVFYWELCKKLEIDFMN